MQTCTHASCGAKLLRESARPQRLIRPDPPPPAFETVAAADAPAGPFERQTLLSPSSGWASASPSSSSSSLSRPKRPTRPSSSSAVLEMREYELDRKDVHGLRADEPRSGQQLPSDGIDGREKVGSEGKRSRPDSLRMKRLQGLVVSRLVLPPADPSASNALIEEGADEPG
jgi:hypothetical protein